MGLEYSDESEFNIDEIDNPIWLDRQGKYSSKIQNMVCCGTYFYYWPQMRTHKRDVHSNIRVD